MDIKFKVNNGLERNHICEAVIKDNDDGTLYRYWDDEGNDWFPCCEVRMYTGFKDMKGNEIYEGDIVEYNFKSLENDLNKTRISEVYLNEFRKSWSVYASVDNSINNDLFKYISNGNVVKVIGNIYETTELLKRP